MYFLASLLAAITFTLLWIFLKQKKSLHFEYGALIFGGAMEGDGFIRVDQLWIDLVKSFWTLFFGLVIYFCALFIPKLVKKHKENK